MLFRNLRVDQIPPCLLELPHWICWKYEERNGIETKVPIGAKTGCLIDSTDPANWVPVDAALARFNRDTRLAGVGFVLSDQDPFTGVDLDDCLDKDGKFLWGEEFVRQLDSYCEVSPSGEGVKLLLVGNKPASAQCVVGAFGPDKIGKVEVYQRRRFFAITGHLIDGAPAEIKHRQAELESLCEQLWPPGCFVESFPDSTQSTSESPASERMRACYKAILAMKLADHSDGSRRLFAACCRCVEYDLSDAEALRVIRKYANKVPFPQTWSDEGILKRLRNAEQKVERGSAARQPGKVRPSLLSVGQLLHDHPNLRNPVIHNLLRIGETMNVIAPPKYGKSWLVTDLALSVATGRRWLDAFDTEAGNVLILDNELHPETSANRIPKVADARGIALEEIAERLFVDNLRGRLQDVNSLQSYFESLKPGFFKIIIMDAFYRFLPKDSDENSNANMTDVYNRLDWYAAMLGCSFVLVHHASKGNQSGKSVTDVGAGAGSQARATDTHLILRQHEQDECVVVDAAVRSWHPLEPICLRWSFPVWNVDGSLDASDLRPERPRKKPKPKDQEPDERAQWTPQRFVDAFVTSEPATIKSIIAAAKLAGVPQGVARDNLQVAEDSKLIYRWSFAVNRPVKFATCPQPEAAHSER